MLLLPNIIGVTSEIQNVSLMLLAKEIYKQYRKLLTKTNSKEAGARK